MHAYVQEKLLLCDSCIVKSPCRATHVLGRVGEMPSFMLALTASLIVPSDATCTKLDRVYEEVEILQLDGENPRNKVADLLSAAKRCAQTEAGQRKALEGYFLAFSVVEAGDELPAFACGPLGESLVLAQKLTEGPTNTRLRKIRSRLLVLSQNTTCEPQEGGEDPLPREKKTQKKASKQGMPIPRMGVDPTSRGLTRGKPPLDDQEGSSLKKAAIASGVVAGVSLTTSVIFTVLAVVEAPKVEQLLANDRPEGLIPDSQVCQVRGGQAAAGPYCKKLNNLKIGAVTSWSILGAAAISTTIWSVLMWKRQRSQLARVAPSLDIGRTHAVWSLSTRF